MTTVHTNISYGYATLIETFFKANELDIIVIVQDMTAYPNGKIILEYENDSETAYGITFMSVKHCGLENMLCDYLIRCGILPSAISVGKVGIKRDMAELDRKWEEHRKLIGLR